jgi:hypothetical protein
MKKIYNASICLLILSGAFSCMDLDTVPSDFVAPQYSYNTEEELNEALTGVYDALGQRLLYSGADGTLLTVFNCTDEMFFNNGKITTSPRTYDYNANDAFHDNIWKIAYLGIERANILLANVHKPKMDEEKRKIIKGEAQFLRAYYHFIIVQNFGSAPLRKMPTASVEDVYNEKTPAKDLYQFIYNEMVEAEKLAPEISEYDYAERITKSAIQGILAKVCLFMAGYPNYMTDKYADALFWAEKVINSGYHELNDDYTKVFINLIQDKYDTKESIWEIGYYTTGSTEIYKERGELGVMLGIRQQNPAYGISNPQYQVHDYLFKKFDIKDLRRDWNIAPFRYTNTKDQAPIKGYWNNSQIYDRFIGKFRREFELIADKSNQNGTNLPLIRYSDVLLIAAEAENAINGPTDKAIEYVNAVRRRAYGIRKDGKAPVKEISVTNEGSGYTASSVKIQISNTSAINAAGLDSVSTTASISGGRISAITVNNRGTFFSTAPAITITGGTGAEAVAILATAADAELTPEQTTDKETLLAVIQDERARELCFEGWRRLDLMRWGILIAKMKEVAKYVTDTAPATYQYTAAAGNNIQDKHNYLPIPSWELSVNNKMSQNHPNW